MAEVNANGCFVPPCLSGDTVPYTIPERTMFYCGIRSKFSEVRPFHRSDGTTAPIQYFMLEFVSDCVSYSNPSKDSGVVACYASRHPLKLYLQKNLASNDCGIFFTGPDQYGTDEAQCFGKEPFAGYATYWKRRIMDVAIYDAERHLEYFGFFRSRDLRTDDPDSAPFFDATGQPATSRPFETVFGRTMNLVL